MPTGFERFFGVRGLGVGMATLPIRRLAMAEISTIAATARFFSTAITPTSTTVPSSSAATSSSDATHQNAQG